MKTQKIIDEIIKTFPSYIKVDLGVVVDKSYNLILSGYALDRTPNCIYINKFYYPLFDFNDFLHLGYSYRLSGCENYIRLKELTNKEIKQLIIDIIKRHNTDIKELRSITDFCNNIEKNS